MECSQNVGGSAPRERGGRKTKECVMELLEFLRVVLN
jgi:hypothetical protein